MSIEMTVEAYLLTGILGVGMATLAVLVFALATSKRPSIPNGEGGGLLEKLANEPVLVKSAILAIITVAGSFGLPVSDVQQASIVGAVLAILAVFAKTTRDSVVSMNKVKASRLAYNPDTDKLEAKN